LTPPRTNIWDLLPKHFPAAHIAGLRRAVAFPKVGVFCLIGVLGGLFGGLLGIGGGSVIAPLLLLTGTLRPAQVSGTTLATVVAISMVGSGTYASLGHLNLGLALPIAMGSVVGSALGALLAKRLSTGLMAILFLVILPYFAIKEFWPSLVGPIITADIVSLGVLGFATGIFSGLLGIGGASLLVPVLVGFFLIDHHEAQGVAIAVALADSLAGTTLHARARNIDYGLLIYLAIPALLAAMAGSLLSDSLSSSVLRNLFGMLMIVVWVTMLVHTIKDPVIKLMASSYSRRLRRRNSERRI